MGKYLSFILSVIVTSVVSVAVMITGLYFGWSDRVVIAICACIVAVLFLLFDLADGDDHQEQMNEQDRDTHDVRNVA